MTNRFKCYLSCIGSVVAQAPFVVSSLFAFFDYELDGLKRAHCVLRNNVGMNFSQFVEQYQSEAASSEPSLLA